MKTTAETTAGTYNYDPKSTTAKAISELQRVDQRRMKIMIDLDGKQEGRIEINGIVFTLGCINTARLNVNARILLDYLLTRFSEIAPFGAGATPETVFKISSITVTLDEFMVMRGLKDKKYARAQFREAAHTLLNIGIKFDYIFNREKGRGKTRKTIKESAHVDGYIFICNVGFRTNDDEPLRNSRIIFDMNPKLLCYLCNRRVMPVDVRMFAINPQKNPHSYNIMRKLTEHYRMNAKKKNEPIRISVRAMLEYCPELLKVDEVNDRHQAQLIMKPVDRDLNALEETYGLIKQQYSHSKGKALTNEELKKMPFETWLGLMIEFYLPDYPVKKSQELIKAKEQETQQEYTSIIPE